MQRLLETVSTVDKFTVTTCVASSVTYALMLTEIYLAHTNEMKHHKRGDTKIYLHFTEGHKNR